MNERDLELALRKQRLVLKSAALRVRLRRDVAGIRPALAVADRVVDVGRWLRRHPGAVAAAAAAVVVARPRFVFRWARRGYFAWRSWRAVRQRIESP